MTPISFSITTSIAAILFAAFLTYRIYKKPSGDGEMQEIAKAIQLGAKTYLNRQYLAIAVTA